MRREVCIVGGTRPARRNTISKPTTIEATLLTTGDRFYYRGTEGSHDSFSGTVTSDAELSGNEMRVQVTATSEVTGARTRLDFPLDAWVIRYPAAVN